MVFTRMVSIETSPNSGILSGPELRLADGDGDHPRPLIDDEPFSDNPSWSPDATRIAYSKLGHEGPNGVVVLDMPEGAPPFFVRTRGGASGVWLDDHTLLVDAWT